MTIQHSNDDDNDNNDGKDVDFDDDDQMKIQRSCKICLKVPPLGEAQVERTAQGEVVTSDEPTTLVTPRLVNGPLQICALNSSFQVFLRANPNIASVLRRDRLPEFVDESLASQFHKVLASRATDGTNLLGIKRVLRKYHPSMEAYQPGSTGGYAVESFEHLVRDFMQEVGGDDRWFHSRKETGEEDNPATCCSQRLQYEHTDEWPFVFMTAHSSSRVQCSLQSLINRWEVKRSKKARNVICPTCSQEREIQVVSTPGHMPNLFTFAFNPHPATVSDVADKISLGEVAYRTIGVIHHRDGHFWVSLREYHEEGDWWMVEDFCGRVDTWRRKYVRSQRGLATTGEGGRVIHKLEENIALLLLERKDLSEDRNQVC